MDYKDYLRYLRNDEVYLAEIAEIAEENIYLLNQINLRETYAVCDEGVLQYAPTGQG